MSDDDDLPPPDIDGFDMVDDIDAVAGGGANDPGATIDDDAIAPPDDLPDDLSPDYAAMAGIGAQSNRSSSGRPSQPTAFGAVPTRKIRRQRTASVWAAGPQSEAANASAIPTLVATKPAHSVHNALRYRMLMKPNPSALLPQEEEALDEAILNFFTQQGLTKTAAAYRTTSKQHDMAMMSPGTSARTSLHAIVTAAANRDDSLFDDERPWNTDSLFQSEWPFLAVEDRGKSHSYATVDRLIEKLILEETNAPLVPRAVEINLTTVFLTLGPTFVTVPVLFSKLFKLFKTIALHGALLGERGSRWQCRVLQMLAAYVSINRIDVIQVETERLLSFLISVSHTGGQHPALVREATVCLEIIQRIGFDDRANGIHRHWLPQPCFDTGFSQSRSATAPRAEADPTSAVRWHDSIFHLEQIDEARFAEQLTTVQFDMFRRIGIREFTNGAWADALLCKAAAPNLTAFLRHREDFVLWLASLVVQPPELAVRQAVRARLVRIAKLLFNHQNYFGAEAVLAAIDHWSVRKLHNTTQSGAMNADEVASLSVLQGMFDATNGKVKGIPFNLSSPCIPVIGAYITELFQWHESVRTIVTKDLRGADLVVLGITAASASQAASLPDGMQSASAATKSQQLAAAAEAAAAAALPKPVVLINWSKITVTAKTVMRVISYQSLAYDIEPDAAVTRFLRGMPGRRSEEALHDMSNERARANGG